MKHKTVAIGMGILFAAAVSTSALVAQKARTSSGAQAETPSTKPKAMAIAPDHAREMVLLGGGEGGWLGVTVADVTAEKALELKLPGEYGAIVQDIQEGSPAAKAGLEKGDVILLFAGEKVRSVAELRRLVRETPVGRTVTIEVSRNGSTQRLSAKVNAAPETHWMSHFEPPRVEIPEVHIPDFDFNFMFGGTLRLGISADELTPQLAQYFGVKQGKGVLVREVEDQTPAQKAGLKAGDIIVKVNDSEISSVADLHKALRGNPDGKRQVTLTIVRDRKEQTLSIQLEPAHQRVGPQRVAQLERLRISPEEMRFLKAEVEAHAAEIKKNSELMRLEGEKVRQEVQRGLQEHRQEMEQLRRDLEKLRQERVVEPI